MTAEEVVDGIERATFGPVPQHEVDAWLDRYLRDQVGSGLRQVLFRAGRVAAVYGCRLDDGRDVALKVHRRGADLAHLAAAVQAQRHLAARGYPCPRPVHGPTVEDGRVVVAETLLSEGELADATEPAVRRALVAGLAEQIDLLRPLAADPVLGGPLRAGAPAWARYEEGPWPVPHDPIFDFTHRPERFGWVDDLAGEAAGVLNGFGSRGLLGSDVIGHSDWYDGNVLLRPAEAGEDGGSVGEVVVSGAFDWDSLTARPEAVLVGMCAGSYTAGGSANAAAPTVAQVAAFLEDYQRARPGFVVGEQWAAAAAACWVMTYNARCEVCFLGLEAEPEPGSALGALVVAGRGYLDLAI
ncbi:phosphotransferase [Kineococcus sp. NBC_00420]|uniref:phosphotransferase n=1 Tax=Kineococcus sp. NBC_00420 TaxID=2903564 RepID=UPI002E240AED